MTCPKCGRIIYVVPNSGGHFWRCDFGHWWRYDLGHLTAR